MDNEVQVTLNLGLVGAMVQIIDAAAAKGTFSGGDITAVGQIRQELVGHLEANAPEEPQTENLTD